MAWLWKYAIRVEGLDEISVLFLPHASTDDDARKTAAASDRCDPKRHTVALYRIACLIDELGDKDSEPLKVVRGSSARGLFLQTGSVEKKNRDTFFAAEGAFDAIATARARKWDNIRLYQCEEIPLT